MYLVTVVSILTLYIIHLFAKSCNNFYKSKKRLDGKTVLVTGGTSGIGFQTAIDFAKRGAKVIIACPFQEEGINAKKKIELQTHNKNVNFKFLDLSSIKSVREFAADVMKTENRLDILVNNAGVGVPRDFTTADGMNSIMQVNYYGHFLLTLLLLPLLKKTGTATEKSRVINTSSVMHKIATSDVTKYNETGYFWFKFIIYSNSKFCMVLFARELTKKLKDSNVVVNCVDPGFVATGLCKSVNVTFGTIAIIFIRMFFKKPWEGIQTTLYAALDDQTGTISGEYFENCKIDQARSLAYDEDKALLLWNNSMKLVKLSDEELERLLN